MTIVAIAKGFEFNYDPAQKQSLEEVARQCGYRYVINGSYFKPNRSHAGLLTLKGRQIVPRAKDRQLTHVVRYHLSEGNPEFIPATSVPSGLDMQHGAFQTGPLIIQKGAVARNYIDRSLNGISKHRRTLLAKDRHYSYFIIVRDWVTLAELGDFLVRLTVFDRSTLDAVNLDGGSSVALFSATYPQLNFNHWAVLPILIGVK